MSKVRSTILGLVGMAMVLVTSGCTDDVAEEEILGGAGDVQRIADTAAGAVTFIYLGRDSEGLTYRVNGAPLSDVELMALVEDMVEKAPETVVTVIRTSEVSSDEANLIAAQVRAKGMAEVKVESVTQ